MTDLLEGYIDHREAAKRLGVSARTLTRWNAHRKGPPHTKIGKVTLYRIAGIAEWLSDNERKPAVNRRKSMSV